MKIAYIVEPRKVIGGGVRAAMNLVKGLKLYHAQDSCIFGIYKNTVEDANVRFIPVKTLKPFSFKFWNSLHQFIKTEKPDIVHCLGLYTALLCLLQKKIFHKKYKVVCTVHRVSMNLRYKHFIHPVVKFIAKNVDTTTFLTKFQKKHYFNNIKFCPTQHTIIPNVIFVTPTDETNIRLKNELKSKLNTDYIFSYVGRIFSGKNIEFFLQVIAQLNHKGINAGGVLVGGYEQSYYEHLRNIITDKHLDNKITFVGYVNNPTSYIAACDFILFPTKSEALPNLLIESYAIGKPVFSSNIPQMADLIENGNNGFTHSTNDLEGFCEEIISVVNNPIKQKEVTLNAIQTYNTLYAPEIVTNKYYKLYSSL